MQLFSPNNPLHGLLPFVMQWIGLSDPDLFPADQLPAQLPDTLKKIYQIAKSKPETLRLFQKQDSLLDLNELHFYDDRVVFLRENQGGWACETELNQIDPPVYVNYIQQKGDKSETDLVYPQLSAFLTTFVLQELTFSSRYTFFEIDDLSYFEEKGFPIDPVWLNAPHVWQGMKLNFHLVNYSVMTMIDEESGTGYAGTQNKEMYHLLSEIGGEI